MKRLASDYLGHGKHYFAEEMSAAEIMAFVEGEAAVFSQRCPGKQTPSEDCAAIIQLREDSGVLVVADGLGGQPIGGKASYLAIKQLEQSLVEAVDARLELRDAILNGFEAANRVVNESIPGAATTLAAVSIEGRTVRPYHVGDSMVLVVGQRGKVKLQTISHSPVGYAVEAGFLDQDEAMHHEQRHLICNMIGSTDMHITVGSTLRLSERDTLLVASDGLFDNLHPNEIVERIRKGSLPLVASNLIQDSLQRMNAVRQGPPSKPDDLTLIAYRPRCSSKT